jgi:hypothetical protein
MGGTKRYNDEADTGARNGARRGGQLLKKQQYRRYSLLLAAFFSLFCAAGGSSAPPTFALLSADAHAVINATQGLAAGIKHGFEGGLYLSSPDGVRHLFPSECMDDIAGMRWDTHMRGGHYTSEDGARTWQRVGTTYNSSASCSPTGADRCASMWAPMPIYDESAGVWRLFVVCYRLGVVHGCGQTDGEIIMRTSATAGRAGIDGPYLEASTVVILDMQGIGGDPSSYEGSGAVGTQDQGTDSFFPYALPNGTGGWAAFFGSHRRDNATTLQWQVGLATAPSLAGPWTRAHSLNPVALEPEGQQATENPIVTPTQDGAWLVAVWDALRSPALHQIGISYSADGLHWSGPQYVTVWEGGTGVAPCDNIRTPLGLVAEPAMGHGIYSLLFTGNSKAPVAYESICRVLLENAAEMPSS